MSTQKKHKLDLFAILGKLSKNDASFYDDLSDEEQKALHPLVVMRWLTGSSDARQLIFINELVNPLVFPLANHKKLLVQLMSLCTSGQNKRYQWIKQKPKTATLPQCVEVIKDYYGYSTKRAREALPLLDDDHILEYAEYLGRQPDDIKVIKKELKSR